MTCREQARAAIAIAGLIAAGIAGGCNRDASGGAGTGGIEPRRAADMLYAVMAADRAVYTRHVVNRLTVEQGALTASEHWKSEPGTLPLPAQMFRMAAEQVAARDVGVTYVLLSSWPINQQNGARTPVEREGLAAVVDNDGAAPFYGRETLGGKLYFTAVYADVAVAPACVDCHNAHPDSPRRDFELGDVMGAVVLRFPL